MKYTLIYENGQYGVRYTDKFNCTNKHFFKDYAEADDFLTAKETEQRNQAVRWIIRQQEKDKK